jgi:predicted nucleotidyltransferase
MYRYLEYLKKCRRDLEENLRNYLRIIKEVASRYGGKAYIFGSYIRGEDIGASDIDVLVEIPDGIDRLEVLHEVRRFVKNRKVEIHVLNESDAQVFKKLIKHYREIN